MSAPVIDADPFATPEDTRMSADPVRGGRYRLPKRDGSHKPYGWMRMTNLVGAFSDQKQLQKWEMRTALAGLVAERRLYDELCATILRIGMNAEDLKAAQEQILEIAERAKDAAGGGRGRDRGNRIHEITECEWREIPYVPTDSERHLIRLFAKALADARLVPVKGMQERIVLLERYEACGKFDTLLRDLVSDLYHIGDTKTQKKFWTFLEVEAQLAGYACSDAVWNADEGRWEDWPLNVNQERGAVLWCPEPTEDRPEPFVEVKALDLERGRDTLEHAYGNVIRRSAASAKKQAVSGHGWTPCRPPTLVEQYAARLRDVATRAEGSRVFAEAQAAGVWCPELEQVAGKVLARLS